MSIGAVEGRTFDGSCNSIMIGAQLIPALKASYGDKLDKGKITRMGTQGITAVTRGTYSCDDAKITMLSDDARIYLFPLFPQVGAGNTAFTIAVIKSHPDKGDDSDLLVDCYCTNIAAAIENSNKADEIELTWTIGRGIQWTDDRFKIYDDGTSGGSSGSFSLSAIFNF